MPHGSQPATSRATETLGDVVRCRCRAPISRSDRRHRRSRRSGLTSYVQTAGSGSATMVMGDASSQATRARRGTHDPASVLTALRNHFFGEERVFFMRLGMERDGRSRAGGRGDLRRSTRHMRVRQSPPATGASPAPSSSAARGIPPGKAQAKDGHRSSSAAPRHARRDVGILVGVNTWAVFAGSPDAATVDGDSDAGGRLPGCSARSVAAASRSSRSTTTWWASRTCSCTTGGPGTNDLARTVKSALDADGHG